MADIPEVMDMEEFDNVVVMQDDDGNEVPFEFIDLIEFEEKEYVVLLPIEADEQPADEVVILEIVRASEESESDEDEAPDTDEDDEDELETYVGVSDMRILTAVFEIFKERNAEMFDFTE